MSNYLMPRILGIDCSGTQAALAIISGDNVVVKEKAGLQQANAIFALYDEMQIDVVDAIGVTIGPGSFTGIRIGLAFAEGLALAQNIPIYGLTSFAAAHDRNGPALVVLDSKRAELYAQEFDAANEGREPFMAVVHELPPHSNPLSNCSAVIPVPNCTAASMAVAAAQHAMRLFKANMPRDILVPMYVRPPDAKPSFPPTVSV